MDKLALELKNLKISVSDDPERADHPPSIDDEQREISLAERIRAGDSDAFKEMFQEYYLKLCAFANSYLNSPDASRDVVQEVFANIWSNRHQFQIDSSLNGYLLHAIRNQSINHLKKDKKLADFEGEPDHQPVTDMMQDEQARDQKRITQKIWKIVVMALL